MENNINNYTKEDIDTLIELYLDSSDSDNLDRANSILDAKYDLNKLFTKKKIKLSHDNETIIEISVFTYIEKILIFETIYEDIPLHINDPYINHFKPATLLVKWRLKIGK